MDSLPAELQQAILTDCDCIDQANIRLVSKALAEACEPLLFRHISICWFSFSLARLQAIAQSRLAKHVKRLTCYTNCLKRVTDRASFASLMAYGYGEAHISVRHEAARPLQALWDARFAMYSSLLVQQNDAYDAVSYGSLCQLLAMLPHLQEVDVANFSSGSSFPPEPLSERKAESLDNIRNLVFYINHMELLRDDWSVAHVLEALALRASTQSQPILTLSIEIRSTSSYLSISGDNEKREISGAALDRVLKGLHKLRILPTWSTDNPCANHDSAYILRSCQELRHLVLGTSNELPGPNAKLVEKAPFTSLIGQSPSPWQKLQDLQLQANMLSRDIVAFLTQHRGRLKHLSIRNSAFDDVPEVLTTIGQALQLSSIYLGSLYTWLDGSDNDESEYYDCYFPNGFMSIEARRWLLTGEGVVPDWNLSLSSNAKADEPAEDLDRVWQDWTMLGDS